MRLLQLRDLTILLRGPLEQCVDLFLLLRNDVGQCAVVLDGLGSSMVLSELRGGVTA